MLFQLCIVTLALFETLIDLNCEDVMLELCLASLSPCNHVMHSQRRRLRDIDPFARAADKFLSLTPKCCQPFAIVASNLTPPNSLPPVPSSARRKSSNDGNIKSLPPLTTTTTTAASNYYSRTTESLYGNYHAYLCDARQKITSCQIACTNWSCLYDGESSPRDNSNTSSVTTLADDNVNNNNNSHNSTNCTNYSPDIENISEDVTDNSQMQNILDNIQSLLNISGGSEENLLSDNESSIKILSRENQEKLDADIAELLNEEITIVTIENLNKKGIYLFFIFFSKS